MGGLPERLSKWWTDTALLGEPPRGVGTSGQRAVADHVACPLLREVRLPEVG